MVNPSSDAQTKKVRILSASFLVPIVILIGSVSWAQSPQPQFAELIDQLQKKPDDVLLREQVIKLAGETKPSIPEAARRAFVQGTTIARDAKDADGQRLAVQSFKEAIKIAPWWGDAYYNLAIAQELVGSFADARDSLSWYIKTKPGEKEERAAQDKIYAIEAKEKLAQANAATESARVAARIRAAEEERRREENALFAGLWKNKTNLGGSQDGIRIRRTLNGSITIYQKDNLWYISGPLPSGSGEAKWLYHINACGYRQVTVSVSSDRRRFEFAAPECYWNTDQKRYYFTARREIWTITPQ